ncbi:zinc-binding dehydrogenase [Gordonia sp. HY285]|uniref:Zinc-binding dehydrogenase n=1 Tax=Gordonia liuliyuniae TaxID=2911517 RepID=A0ABS9ITP2_9ACTN|nr:zinc-binding dehydrogenase [Gordonia liuliyuniae]MCF8588945.1 zinc-binding dehydrogenase [Gordonia liuliyuniae]MCF8609174.1 zinc-binding dehydrogenase [Gordonia liuliyuniae]
MKAWQFERAGTPLELRDLPEPRPAADEVLIEIKAAGLCHTDVGILHDPQWSERIGPFPLTLGHELAGVIIEVGPDVEGFAVGDRVGVFPAGRTRPGLGRDGGYSFRCTALPEDLVRVPAEVGFEQAALGTDAGRAAYRALVRRGGVTSGDKVGIIGFGGLGQMAARIAVVLGATVFVAEKKKSLWSAATEIGAQAVSGDITDFADEKLDLVVDFAGFGTTTAAAIEAVREFGTVVQVGMGKLSAEISTGSLIFKQVTLIGSRSGSVEDIAAVYELFAAGELNPLISPITFEDIPAALDRLHRGEAEGRLVAVYE